MWKGILEHLPQEHHDRFVKTVYVLFNPYKVQLKYEMKTVLHNHCYWCV